MQGLKFPGDYNMHRRLRRTELSKGAIPTLMQTLTDLYLKLLLLLLSRFSRVRLCVTPQTAAHQAPLSLGFSRQEYWSGLPFPSPMHERGDNKTKIGQRR